MDPENPDSNRKSLLKELKSNESWMKNKKRVEWGKGKTFDFQTQSDITVKYLEVLMKKSMAAMDTNYLLIVDCRPYEEFLNSHINHPNCIPVPSEFLKAGLSSSEIGLKLLYLKDETNSVFSKLWTRRWTFQHIVIYDLDSSIVNFMSSGMMLLHNILNEESQLNGRFKTNPPKVLQGGLKTVVHLNSSLLILPKSSSRLPPHSRSPISSDSRQSSTSPQPRSSGYETGNDNCHFFPSPTIAINPAVPASNLTLKQNQNQNLPSGPMGRSGDFFVEEQEILHLLDNSWIGTSVVDTYANIIFEKNRPSEMLWFPSAALGFDGRWKSFEYLHDFVNILKGRYHPSVTTIATVLNVGRHWVLLLAEKYENNITFYVVDTLKSYCPPLRLKAGIKKLFPHFVAIFQLKLDSAAWSLALESCVGIVQQDDQSSCGPAALFYLEKLFKNQKFICEAPSAYKEYRKTILMRILKTTERGRGLLASKNSKYSRFLNGKTK